MIKIRMLNICSDSILNPQNLYLNHTLTVKNFSPNGKKQMLSQFIKNEKQLIENYLPILLPVCGKILERLIYNKMFEFFTENELISHNQPGFKPRDSCIIQLLCITHDNYQSLDDRLQTRSVVLGISKVFDKVWHQRFSLQVDAKWYIK